MKSPNAFLSFVDTETLDRLFLPLWVMELQQEFGLSGQVQQSAAYSHFYAKNLNVGMLIIQGRTLDQASYNVLAEFIRKHQLILASQRGFSNAHISGVALPPISFMHLNVPSEGVYVDGMVTSFEAGERRFNPAPPYTINFEVLNDRIEERNIRPWFLPPEPEFPNWEIFPGEVQLKNSTINRPFNIH